MKRDWYPTTRQSPMCLEAWRSFIARKAATQRPSLSQSVPPPSVKRRRSPTRPALGSVAAQRSLGTGNEPANLLSQVNQLYQVSNYAEAIPDCPNVMPKPSRRATALRSPECAVALNSFGEAVFAAPTGWQRPNRFTSAPLAIQERALGAGHPGVGVLLNNLALLYQDEGQSSLAEPLLLRALSIYEKTLGNGHPGALRTSQKDPRPTLYANQGRLLEAEPLDTEALLRFARRCLVPTTETSAWCSTILLNSTEARVVTLRPSRYTSAR